MKDEKYTKILAKEHDLGTASLTLDEVKYLKYHDVDNGHIVESQDYSDAEKESFGKVEPDKRSNEERAVVTGDKIDKQQEIVTHLLTRGNSVWSKSYDYHEDGVSFKISIHAPNLGEEGRIQAMTSRYLEGRSRDVPNYWYVVFNTISLIRICGEEVPDVFKEDNLIYMTPTITAWLENIYVDFGEWLARFRY